jgi:hypothetical protein
MLLSLPKCKVNDDFDIDYDNKSVCFVLEHGVDNALCHMKGEIIVEAFDVCQGGDVENGSEVNFKYLQIGETSVLVDQSDFSIQANQEIELTESQISDLNEKLKNEMVRV